MLISFPMGTATEKLVMSFTAEHGEELGQASQGGQVETNPSWPDPLIEKENHDQIGFKSINQRGIENKRIHNIYENYFQIANISHLCCRSLF